MDIVNQLDKFYSAKAAGQFEEKEEENKSKEFEKPILKNKKPPKKRSYVF